MLFKQRKTLRMENKMKKRNKQQIKTFEFFFFFFFIKVWRLPGLVQIIELFRYVAYIVITPFGPVCSAAFFK